MLGVRDGPWILILDRHDWLRGLQGRPQSGESTAITDISHISVIRAISVVLHIASIDAIHATITITAMTAMTVIYGNIVVSRGVGAGGGDNTGLGLERWGGDSSDARGIHRGLKSSIELRCRHKRRDG